MGGFFSDGGRAFTGHIRKIGDFRLTACFGDVTRPYTEPPGQKLSIAKLNTDQSYQGFCLNAAQSQSEGHSLFAICK